MDLDTWFAETVLPDFGTRIGYDLVAIAFFKEVFAQHGALTGEALWTLAAKHQFDLAKRAAEAVAKDIRATADKEVEIEPVQDGSVVRIKVNGEFDAHDGGRLFAFDLDRALVEVAETVQDLLTEQWWAVWPLCPEHGDHGLCPEPSKPVASWSCRIGPHTVGAVGALPRARDGQQEVRAG